MLDPWTCKICGGKMMRVGDNYLVCHLLHGRLHPAPRTKDVLLAAPGQQVLDPYAGTGTTLRVCKKIDRPCTLIEYSLPYCKEIAKEHDLEVEK